FWGRIAAKGLGATILANLLFSWWDDDDFLTRYKKAWEAENLRWLDVDITPLYRKLGGAKDSRAYFSILGHFRDPLKFIYRPGGSAGMKQSVLGRWHSDFASGADWRGRRFTSWDELLGIDDKGQYKTSRSGHYRKGQPKGGQLRGHLTAKAYGGRRGVGLGQIPSYLAYETYQSMPIPIASGIAWLAGEQDGFTSLARTGGFLVSTVKESSKPKPKRAGILTKPNARLPVPGGL
ncbi:MAG TPA: hypothetical protein VNA25_29000, partial [Phycisphaerae bacterium]|nr:hypothetical protein [Phycisphaerae bacterium]